MLRVGGEWTLLEIYRARSINGTLGTQNGKNLGTWNGGTQYVHNVGLIQPFTSSSYLQILTLHYGFANVDYCGGRIFEVKCRVEKTQSNTWRGWRNRGLLDGLEGIPRMRPHTFFGITPWAPVVVKKQIYFKIRFEWIVKLHCSVNRKHENCRNT